VKQHLCTVHCYQGLRQAGPGLVRLPIAVYLGRHFPCGIGPWALDHGRCFPGAVRSRTKGCAKSVFRGLPATRGIPTVPGPGSTIEPYREVTSR